MYAWTNECTLTCTIIISVFLFFFFNNPILSHLLKKNPTFSPPSICQNLNRQSIHIPKLPLYIHVSHYQRWIFIFRNNIIELPTIFSKFFFVKIFSFSHSLRFLIWLHSFPSLICYESFWPKKIKEKRALLFLFWMPLKFKK